MKSPLLYLLLYMLFSGVLVAQENDSITRLIKSKDAKELPRLFNDLSVKYKRKGAQENALYWAERAKQAAEKLNDSVELYYAYMNLSEINLRLSHIDTTVQYLTKALKLARAMHNPTLKARTYNELGIVYLEIADFEKSLSSYLQSLRLIEDSIPNLPKEKLLFYKSLVLNNIGTVYSKMNQLDKSLSYRMKALSIRQRLQDTSGIASCLQNIGVIHEKKNNLDSAYAYYSKALQYRKKLGDKRDIAELILNTGIIKMKKGDYLPAEQSFLQAIRTFEAFQDYKHLSETYLNLAGLYMKLNKLSQAFEMLKKGLSFARKSSYKIKEKEAYALLSDYYAQRGAYKKAWEYQKRYTALNDSIFNLQMADKIANVQNKYEIEKREKEIQLLRRDNEIKALKVKQKTILSIVLLILLVLIILLLISVLLVLNRRKLKQKHIEMELEKSELVRAQLREKNEYQKKQLITHAMNMLQKNKLLLEMDKELSRFYPKADESLRKHIRSFQRQIKRNMNLEKDWEMFKMYFEEVNKNFYTNLRKISNELTPGDLKLAALVKLNLNIKEAAAVLNISPESLRKARYRLRKKLHLKYGDNLSEFLNGL